MVSLDHIFELFTRERRRYVLYYLEECDRTVTLKELAAKIQEWESETPPSALPDDDYHDVIITLKHQHIPKAAEAEFVEYAPEDQTIELSGSPPEFSVILSVARAIEQPDEDDIWK